MEQKSEVGNCSYKNVNDLIKEVDNQIARLISRDPVLKGLPVDITDNELESALDLEHGRSWKIFIRRDDNHEYELSISKTATLLDLKQTFRSYFELHQKRGTCLFIPNSPRISWKYIWKRYNLSFNGHELDQDRKKLREFGIHNQAKLCFQKKHHKK